MNTLLTIGLALVHNEAFLTFIFTALTTWFIRTKHINEKERAKVKKMYISARHSVTDLCRIYNMNEAGIKAVVDEVKHDEDLSFSRGSKLTKVVSALIRNWRA